MTNVDTFGVVGAILGVSQFAGTVSDAGMATYLSRSRALGNDGASLNAIRLNVVGSVSLAIGLSVAIFVVAHKQASPAALALLGLAVALEKSVETLLAIPLADKNRLIPLQSVLARRGLHLVAFLILVCVQVPAVWAFSLGFTVAGIAGQVHVRRHVNAVLHTSRRKVRDPWLIASVKAGFPFLVNTLSNQARALDVTLVAAFSSAIQAGLYSAATRISGPLLLIPGAMTAIVVPHAVSKDDRGAWRLCTTMTIAHVAAIIPLSGVAAFSHPIAILLFGERYAGSAPTFSVALVGVPFIALSSILAGILQGRDLERPVARLGLSSSTLLIVAMAFGAAQYGALGVALSVALAYLLKSAALLVLAKQRLQKGDSREEVDPNTHLPIDTSPLIQPHKGEA